MPLPSESCVCVAGRNDGYGYGRTQSDKIFLETMKYKSGNNGDCRIITGWYRAARNHLRESFKRGFVGRESIDSTSTADNYSCACAEMRGKARDACI